MSNWPTIVLATALGVTVGAALAWLLLRSRYAVPLATAATERDLLRARVEHLTTLADQEAGRHADTVELVAPLRETLLRVETQVHALERDRGEQFARVACTGSTPPRPVFGSSISSRPARARSTRPRC